MLPSAVRRIAALAARSTCGGRASPFRGPDGSLGVLCAREPYTCRWFLRSCRGLSAIAMEAHCLAREVATVGARDGAKDAKEVRFPDSRNFSSFTAGEAAQRGGGAAGAGAVPPSAGGHISHTTAHHPPHAFTEAPTLPEGYQAKFAIIPLGGTQYKVTVGDVIVAEKLPGRDIGDVVQIDDVLLHGTRERTMVGRPTVAGSGVSLLVIENTRDKKVIIFKKRRRKNSQRTRGFRREVTLLRVTAIEP
ncbi:unnamed protein product [Phaeothamnion confervicola]